MQILQSDNNLLHIEPGLLLTHPMSLQLSVPLVHLIEQLTPRAELHYNKQVVSLKISMRRLSYPYRLVSPFHFNKKWAFSFLFIGAFSYHLEDPPLIHHMMHFPLTPNLPLLQALHCVSLSVSPVYNYRK
jgi:hypothetical protein